MLPEDGSDAKKQAGNLPDGGLVGKINFFARAACGERTATGVEAGLCVRFDSALSVAG